MLPRLRIQTMALRRSKNLQFALFNRGAINNTAIGNMQIRFISSDLLYYKHGKTLTKTEKSFIDRIGEKGGKRGGNLQDVFRTFNEYKKYKKSDPLNLSVVSAYVSEICKYVSNRKEKLNENEVEIPRHLYKSFFEQISDASEWHLKEALYSFRILEFQLSDALFKILNNKIIEEIRKEDFDNFDVITEIALLYFDNLEKVSNEDWEILHDVFKLSSVNASFKYLTICSWHLYRKPLSRVNKHGIKMNKFLENLIIKRIQASPPLETVSDILNNLTPLSKAKEMRSTLLGKGLFHEKVKLLNLYDFAIVASKIILPWREKEIRFIEEFVLAVYKQALSFPSFDDDPKSFIIVMQSLSKIDHLFSFDKSSSPQIKVAVWKHFQTQIENKANKIKYTFKDVESGEDAFLLNLNENFTKDPERSPDEIIISYFNRNHHLEIFNKYE